MKPPFLKERVRRTRLQQGLSQTNLAKATSFASSTISGIEKGTIYPSERAIRLISQALGKKVEYFTDPNIPEDGGNIHPDTSLGSTSPASSSQPFISEIAILLEASRLLVQQGECSQALHKLKMLHGVSIDENQLQTVQFIEAQILNRTNQTRQARELLRTLLTQVKIAVPDPELGIAPATAQLYFELAVSYLADHQLEASIENYEAVLEVLGTAAQEHSLGFKTYAELGRVWRQRDNLEKAAYYYEKAQHHPYARKDDRVMAQLLLSEGLKLATEKRFAEAGQKLVESERLYEKLKLIEQASSVASYLNVVRAELNEFDKLEEIPQFNASLPESSGSTTEVIIRANQVAVLRLKGDSASLKQATLQMERTLQFMSSKIEEIQPLTIVQVYHEAALLQVSCKQEEEAIKAFEKALEVLRNSKQAGWNEFEKIYDDYEQSLLDWGRDQELAQMSRQRLLDKKLVNSGYAGGGSSSTGTTPLSSAK
jgi:transcriptional regulator with XRE-family HTH domain